MAAVSTNIKIDPVVKAQAQELFAELGMNLSTAVNVFLRQAVRMRSIPFRVSVDDVPNEETRAAIHEVRRMMNDPHVKTYHSFDEILAELDAEENDSDAV